MITRILRECKGVIALGGGAFMTEATRVLLKKQTVSIWLKADKDVLLERALRRKTRPLPQVENPREILQKLIEKRYPFYALADITLHNCGKRREAVVRDCLNLLDHYLQSEIQKQEL